MTATNLDRWPELPLAAWRDTRDTLHLWTQIVGKVRLALTPWLNHCWHVPLYVTARGLTPSPIPDGARTLRDRVRFHRPRARGSAPATAIPPASMLRPMTVAEFYADVMAALERARHRRRDHDDAERDRRARSRSTRTARTPPTTPSRGAPLLARAARGRPTCSRISAPAFSARRARCISSGARFDLAVTRFSGRSGAAASRRRAASARCGGARGLFARSVERRLLAGRRRPIDEAAFYSYAYPAPAGFADGAGRAGRGVLVDGARRIHPALRRGARGADPDATLLAFLQSTYDAAADLGHWDRAALECALGAPGKCRAV